MGHEIAAIAAQQHGLVTLGQLRSAGVPARTARRWTAAGRLHRIHRGVFAVGHPALTSEGHYLAAVLACGPGAVLSHRSAAAHLGIRRTSASRVDVTVARRTGRSRKGIAVHSAATLRADERTVERGVPCTTVARTIVDLSGCVHPEALEYAIHRAQTRRLLERDRVAAVLAHLQRRRGNAAVRRILRITDRSEDEVRSSNERRFLRLVRDAGFPLPKRNLWIVLDGYPAGGVEVDFAWPELRLAVEIDSAVYHDTDRALVNDRRRDRALMLAGWRVVRFADRDLEDDAVRAIAQLDRFIAAAVSGVR